MKTTLELPDELVREAKLRAVTQGRALKDLIAEFIRQGLGMSGPETPRLPAQGSLVQIGPGGLPVVHCRADAAATLSSLHDLLQLEQQTQAEEDVLHARVAG